MDFDLLLQMINEIELHISVLNDDYTALSVDVAVLKSQMSQITWLMRVIIGGFIGLLLTQFWQVSVLKKSNKK